MKHHLRVFCVFMVVILPLLLTVTAIKASPDLLAPMRISVSVCKNGLKIAVTNLRAGEGPTEIKLEHVGRAVDNSANINLPSSTPLDFTTFSHSSYIAGSGNNSFSVNATEYVYFAQEQPLGNEIVTSFGTYINKVLVGEPLQLSTPIGKCLVPAQPAPTSDLSGAIQKGQTDGRAQPVPSDTMAIYCIVVGRSAGTIVIDGIGADGTFRGNEFKQSLVAAANPNGISRPAFDGRGTIVVRGSGSSYRAEWVNGPAGFYQAKAFTCSFDKSKYNKNKNQLEFPTGFGSDGRIDPNPTDRVAIYCETDGNLAGTIRVVGIDVNMQGYALGNFKYKDLVKVSPNPITRNVEVGLGTISLRVDNDDNFIMEWIAGEWGNQSKVFKCRF